MAALETSSDEQYSVSNGQCTVRILDKKTGKPFKIVNVNTGFGNPVLETGTEWCLRIDCPGCFKFKVKIGQKDVNIDKRIIFSDEYILEENQGEFSFMFLSLPSELQETLGSDLKVGENNIISIEVQQFTENKPKPLLPSSRYDEADSWYRGTTRGFSSGTNVARETSVGKIKTQTTTSTFTEKGGKLLFTLEFICQQTDQEKLEANRPYFTTGYPNLEKNLENHQSKAEFHTSQIDSISKQMKELEFYKPRTVEQQREEQLSKLIEQQREEQLSKWIKQQREEQLSKLIEQQREEQLSKWIKQQREEQLSKMIKQQREEELSKWIKQQREEQLSKLIKEQREEQLSKLIKQQGEEQLSKLMFPTPGKGDDNV